MKKSQEMLADMFGQNVFSDKVMQTRLPQNVYKTLHRTVDEGAELDPAIAEVILSLIHIWNQYLHQGCPRYASDCAISLV